MTTATTVEHGASHGQDRINTHQLFYRDGLQHPFTIKRSVLNDVRALEARRWRMLQRANAWWARSPPLIEALADAGGIAHARPRASGISGWAEGWVELAVEWSESFGQRTRMWSFDWLKAAPCPPLHVDLAVALLRHWARGERINTARLNFDAVLEQAIQDAMRERGRARTAQSRTYQVVLNGRSYWYFSDNGILQKLAWPGDEMETVEL